MIALDKIPSEFLLIHGDKLDQLGNVAHDHGFGGIDDSFVEAWLVEIKKIFTALCTGDAGDFVLTNVNLEDLDKQVEIQIKVGTSHCNLLIQFRNSINLKAKGMLCWDATLSNL